MAADLNYCFSNTNTYEDVLSSSSFQSTTNESLIFNLSILKEKAQHVHSIAAAMFFSETQSQSQSMVPANPTSIDHMTNVANLLQEIIAIASNVMFTCSQNTVVVGGPTAANNMLEFGQMTQSHLMFDQWSHGGENSFGSVTCNTRNENISVLEKQKQKRTTTSSGGQKRLSPGNYDIIEMDAAELLAKYTHYCQVCGKGFKRDANLRMHMRAHGDEYKSTAALANPVSLKGLARKYSCPQEGCRWNRKHAKFQPLKSMICMKNHYKRSHCPKLYACKRCHRKQFSVLSDLRTHEKHCGDVKWRCSCGTTFSRKDKLMGHVGLFAGHTPVFVDSSGSLIKSQ